MNQINQIDQTNQMDQTDQITRQTGLVPDVRTIDVLACPHSFPQPARRSDPATAGSVSSSHDKLNETKRLKRQVGYEEMNNGNGVPNGFINHLINPTPGGHHRAVFGNNQAGGISRYTSLVLPWKPEYR
jgi:hypothetical protein